MASPYLPQQYQKTPQKREFFAQKGALIMGNIPSLGNLDDLSGIQALTDRSQYPTPRDRQQFGSVPNIKEPLSAYRPTEITTRNILQNSSFVQPGLSSSATLKTGAGYQLVYSHPQNSVSFSRLPTQDFGNIRQFQSPPNMPPMGGYTPTNRVQNVNYPGYPNQPIPNFTPKKDMYRFGLEEKLDKQSKVLDNLVTQLDKQIKDHNKMEKDASMTARKRPSALLTVNKLEQRPVVPVMQPKPQPQQQEDKKVSKEVREYPKMDKSSFTDVLCEAVLEQLLGENGEQKRLSPSMIMRDMRKKRSERIMSIYSPKGSKSRDAKEKKKKSKSKKKKKVESEEEEEEEDFVPEINGTEMKEVIMNELRKKGVKVLQQPQQQLQQQVPQVQAQVQVQQPQQMQRPIKPTLKAYPTLENLDKIAVSRQRTNYVTARPTSYMDFDYDRKHSDDEESDVEEKPAKKVEIPQPKKKGIKERRKDAKSRIRVRGWCLVFPLLLANAIKKNALVEREAFLKVISHNISSSQKLLESFIFDRVGATIQKMINDKNHSFIFVGKKPTDSKVDKECKALMTYFKDIVIDLIGHTKGLPIDFFRFLASLSEENSNVPNDYFTDFELKRHQFNFFGKFKGMTPVRSKLVIGGVIMRVFVQKMIMKPWEAYNMDIKKVNQEKLLNIGSVIYNLMLEVFENYAAPLKDNQGHLPFDLKIRPKKAFPQAIEPDILDSKLRGKINTNKERQIIEGFYSKEQLECFFSERKGLVNEAKARIDDWLEQFYEISHQEAKAVTDA